MGETEGAGGVTPAHKKLASQLYGAIFFLLRTVTFGIALYMAYDIRMYAIKDFGRLIHEFDPWFNFRATQYLYDNGIERFFKWYDYMSWYPLGRPVGTTIYPGMQLTSVFITRTLEYIGDPRFLMSLNDVCVFIPVWGGTCATLFLGLLAGECSGNSNAAVFSALIMSIIPAHIMRSVGGGYDNESVAMTAICATFYFWVRSLRSDRSWPIGFLAGLAYFYMVAAWGGYIFVLNMVGVHAGILVLLGRFSYKLHHAYSLFFIVGTAGALQIPVVGLAPFKSAEQLGPLGIFFLLQLLCVIEYMAEKAKMTSSQKWGLAFKIFAVAGGVAMAVIAALYPTGYFGPLSVRIRSLFIEHTKTGNMLVDSVAEHQPASPQAYW
jgi:dolichyl-diphosphooligosaccharide--protein glycosyltransferase